MAYPPKKATDDAFSEIKSNPPKVVKSTLQKFGPERARKQTIAIGLSKARKASGMSTLKRPKAFYAARKYSKV